MRQCSPGRRLGIGVIALALLLRLTISLPGEMVLSRLMGPNTLSLLIFLETGLWVRFSPSPGENGGYPAESPPPWAAPEDLPRYTAREAGNLKLHNTAALEPDLAELLTRPLNWYLPLPEPTVLILHTHATESYTPSEKAYLPSGSFRTLEEGHNMLSVGDRVAQLLEKQGIRVIQDRTLHDYPGYDAAYGRARTTIRDTLARFPSIQLVLDLHRDALDDGEEQLRTQVLIDGRPCAQLMLVLGAGAPGAPQEHWQENLSLGLKLMAQLERQAPGITRPMALREARYNQDLSPGALLVEVGAAGNTLEEALLAAEQLALAIAALAKGTG